ncbi:galectin-5-like isoform X2 [Spodoptera litura]|uniref:Galectin n=1 Tax=Spodoptera litura TaxID=69820 RepID=A0A9J7DYC2_SPOLT|nr:galectin-5-like isoform X2 [Spodoptera litura]
MAAITNPRVPFTNSVSGGMYPGRKMVVKGGIPPGSNGFSLDLVCGSDEIAFHFNPRFGEQRIVRNSLLSGNWGAEERSGGMPLIKGEPFEAQFECQEDCIREGGEIPMDTSSHRGVRSVLSAFWGLKS